jgi:hypothetical protein
VVVAVVDDGGRNAGDAMGFIVFSFIDFLNECLL